LIKEKDIFITILGVVFLAVLVNTLPVLPIFKRTVACAYDSQTNPISQKFDEVEKTDLGLAVATPEEDTPEENIPEENIQNNTAEEPIKKEVVKTNIIEAIVAKVADVETSFFDVPFFSQFKDISATNWKKVGCGVASLTMIIDYYEPGEISVDALLDEGINSGAYTDAGWSHRGLALLAEDHGLFGTTRDFSSHSMDTAFEKFETAVKEGPVIASVHYTFDPASSIPHLVVINGIDGDILSYSDPADGQGTISIEKFKRAWKKRYIEIRPSA